MYSPGIGIGIIPRMSVTSVSVVTATIATGIGITSFTANWNAFSGAQYYLLDVSTSSSFSTFVYQDQVVLAPTTAYVVIGLTENTTYYYRVRAAVGVDEDAVAFFGRVYAASGSLTYTEVTATQTLVADLKANSLWTPMKAIYPMVGASAAACAQNLKSSSFTGTFTSGWTFASTGVTPNGTSAFMNTGLNSNTQLSSSLSFAIYSRTAIIGLADYSNAITAGNNIIAYLNYAALSSAQWLGGAGYVLYTNTNSGRGFYNNQRINSTTVNAFINSTKALINTTDVFLGWPNNNMNIGAYLLNGNFSQSVVRENAFASIGDGLLDAQASAFYTIVQNFQVALSRAV